MQEPKRFSVAENDVGLSRGTGLRHIPKGPSTVRTAASSPLTENVCVCVCQRRGEERKECLLDQHEDLCLN